MRINEYIDYGQELKKIECFEFRQHQLNYFPCLRHKAYN